MKKILNEIIKTCAKYYLFSDREEARKGIEKDLKELEMPAFYRSGSVFLKPEEGEDILICKIYPLEIHNTTNIIEIKMNPEVLFVCETDAFIRAYQHCLKIKRNWIEKLIPEYIIWRNDNEENLPKLKRDEKAWDKIQWFILDNNMQGPGYIVEKMGFRVVGIDNVDYFYKDCYDNIFVKHGNWYGLCPENIYKSAELPQVEDEFCKIKKA